ncbi:MAG: FG-GAP-like repeat-containing protein, partial [Candidatus Pacebacteria bacterium]|nr:FG-GAP-like repeat-containing protein [Candidatus Paceibacterota bacterium]
MKRDIATIPALPITEKDGKYQIRDTEQNGIVIEYPNRAEKNEENPQTELQSPEKKPTLTLDFPKNYSEPIEVKLDNERTISITDLSGKDDYTVSTLASETTNDTIQEGLPNTNLWQKIRTFGNNTKKLFDTTRESTSLRYVSRDGRKSLLYTFAKDQATGEKKLKHWTIYERGTGIEEEQYKIANAKVKVNDEGIAEVYYFGTQETQNEQVKSEVGDDLMARAQRTLAKEMGNDILSGNHTPDFIIPAPYYIDKEGKTHEAEWQWNEEKQTLSVKFTADRNAYPLALDPTLSFTAPGQSNSGSVITGEANSSFGNAMTTGDFNSDGKMDLAVGASGYDSGTGRVYLFYGSSIATGNASGADAIITGETTSNYFGISLTSGDFNADGQTDLAIGAYFYISSTGRVYIFYNDGTIPTTAATADAIITGETTSNYFGISLTSGDWNSDGKIDLAVGATGYSTNTGRVYIFYNGSIITENASGADVIITGETTSNYFGSDFTIGDLNSDGKVDLVVGAYGYSTNTGRVYIFYNGSIITENASGADVIITGENTQDYFGDALTAGDFNADGTIDLAVGAWDWDNAWGKGRVYIFYNDGSYPSLAASADVVISESVAYVGFGRTLASGDFNSDGKTDLAVGELSYSSATGRVYIFYNGSIITESASGADVIITGETTSNNFGRSLAVGDWNTDGKTDLSVGANGYASSTGRVYVFYSQNGQINTNQNISGTVSGDQFGSAMVSGDFNADGRSDLAVSAYGYSTNTGRVYVFYNTGIYRTTTSASADVIITGEAISNYFGSDFTAGDLNNDGKVDLVVGAYGYSTNTGRVYIFYNGSIITENASGADVIITGETVGDYFGSSMVTGDFNADGKGDITIGAEYYGTLLGRAYIFYADGTNDFGVVACFGSAPTVCASANADAIITGTNGLNYTYYRYFTRGLAAGDFNSDGKTDLTIGSHNNVGGWGNVQIFYNDGSYPTFADSADVTIANGVGFPFGTNIVAGDFNADGRMDIATNNLGYSQIYIFYNDGTYPAFADNADVIITSAVGNELVSGDFNADGRTDLAVSNTSTSTNTGSVYIFYNDGTLPTTAATADVIITGETTNNYFGIAMTAGDMNSDGKTDLIIGAYGYSTNTGRVYFYQTEENYSWKIHSLPPGQSLRTGVSGTGQEMQISGESSSSFGSAFASGDFNADGKIDLAVGASGYNSDQGRVYLFYNTGSLSTSATNADVVITGANGSRFGSSLAAGDLDSDGKTDIIVGCVNNIYIFYNDGSYPITATTADVAITGGTNFGAYGLIVGDFNADGKADVAAGDDAYSTYTGAFYIFYNDGSIPTTIASADVTITGATNTYFGRHATAGDFNADGKTDIAIGTFNSWVYIFHNDGAYPATYTTADITITG